MTKSKFKTIVIRDAQLFWTKLDKPVDTFNTGTPSYEVQIRTSDEKVANEWKAMNLNVVAKEEDGNRFFKVGLKRKSKNKSGTENPRPDVYINDIPASDDERRKIGNGSIGHVRCFQYDYNAGGRSGIATQFNAIKVVELKEFESGDDIDF